MNGMSRLILKNSMDLAFLNPG